MDLQTQQHHQHSKPLTDDQFDSNCRAVDLEPARIRLHQKRIKRALAGGQGNLIKIFDTCRLDNGGIFRISSTQLQKKLDGVLSFIPAAGASSRYLAPFTDLIQALEANDQTAIKHSLQALDAGPISLDLLPEYARSVIAKRVSPENINLNRLRDELTQPKAFFPCVVSGETFLDIKILEDQALSFLAGTVFVSSPSALDDFRKKLPSKSSPPVKVIEQTLAQSTVRFDEQGEAVLDEKGNFSIVPAGHGTLASCLPALKKDFPNVHSVLIRNVDNLIGNSQVVRSEVEGFVSLHNTILDSVKLIRAALAKNDWSIANQQANQLLNSLNLNEANVSRKNDSLWRVQEKLFHGSQDFLAFALETKTEEDTLKAAFSRPVNTLGQVPNTQRDVGGTPVFSKIGDHTYKICLEVPHASEADKQKFLADPKYATHFNPVFAVAEINFSPTHYEQAQHTSWLLSKKSYKGSTVYYHESVLYELLGNNILANTMFVEIPRNLFHPHKTIEDCGSRARDAWIS